MMHRKVPRQAVFAMTVAFGALLSLFRFSSLNASRASILGGIADLDWHGMDVVELAPAYDHADISAIAAATVVQRHIGALARKRRAP